MKIMKQAGLALLFASVLAVSAAAEDVVVPVEEMSEVEYYAREAARQAAEDAALQTVEETSRPVFVEPAANEGDAFARNYAATQVYMAQQECPPTNVFVAIPQYFNSRAKKGSGYEVGGTKLKNSKSSANGMGITVAYNKVVTDWLTLGFMYEYAFMKVNGGMAVPDDPALAGRESSRYYSHVVGFLPEFDFKEFGKLQLSVIQGFDRPSGTETFYSPAGVDARSNDKYGTNVTSLMAWYQKDFELGCGSGWKLTPYAGWRSLYVDIQNSNNWSQPNPNAADYRTDDNTWVHLISGGLKIGYQRGSFGFNVRGGVNHRTSHDDIPGYGNRATAPGVVHFSHRANQDRTVGTFGAGISYVASKRLIVSAGYDGFYGRDTSAHMGTLTFAIPF